MNTKAILPMTASDLRDVARLSEQLGYPTSAEALAPRLAHILKRIDHKVFVYHLEKKVVGWIHLEVVLDLIEEAKLEIKALVVDENYRGLKIGAELIEAAKEWARTQKLNTLYLSCNQKRVEAHRFYLKQGFQQQKASYFFELNLSP